jgi:hypothetical protein
LRNLANLTPRIRVEVYVPIRYASAYHDSLRWLIKEFTELRGGCTVNENVGGYYLSRAGEVKDDRVNIVYSDFSLNWNKATDRAEVLRYCVHLKQFLLDWLVEEEVLISVYPVSHVAS